MAEPLLVVRSKVKAMAKKMGVRLSGKAVVALSSRVEDAIKSAAVRARANGRQTIQQRDI